MSTVETFREAYEANLRTGDLGVADAERPAPRRLATKDELMEFAKTEFFELMQDDGDFMEKDGTPCAHWKAEAFGRALAAKFQTWAKNRGIY